MKLQPDGTPDPRCACESELRDEHACPYQCEVNDDHELMCTCCEFCEQECTDYI